MTICDTIADEYYESRLDMAMAFAEILNEEVRELAAAGTEFRENRPIMVTVSSNAGL